MRDGRPGLARPGPRRRASGRSRTDNPRITNAVLCQLKLRWRALAGMEMRTTATEIANPAKLRIVAWQGRRRQGGRPVVASLRRSKPWRCTSLTDLVGSWTPRTRGFFSIFRLNGSAPKRLFRSSSARPWEVRDPQVPNFFVARGVFVVGGISDADSVLHSKLQAATIALRRFGVGAPKTCTANSSSNRSLTARNPSSIIAAPIDRPRPVDFPEIRATPAACISFAISSICLHPPVAER